MADQAAKTEAPGETRRDFLYLATYFSLAASYFTKVRVVAVVGDDFGPDQEKVFQQHGIDIRGRSRRTCRPSRRTSGTISAWSFGGGSVPG